MNEPETQIGLSSLVVKAFGISDTGRVRPSNEDQFLIAELTKTMRIWQTSLPEKKAQFGNERGHLFLVADGMGGRRAGEQASALAVVAIEQFALNIDIAPTLLDLAQVPVPKSIQGRSLLPLLKDPQTPWRESFLTEYFEEKQYRTPSWEAVRTHRWKYIHYPDLNDMDELYEIKADPHELKNRIKDPQAKPALEEMKAELKKLTPR